MNPYQQYRRNQVETAGPGQLVLLLFNGALRFIQQAVGAMESRDLEGANRYLGRAQAIISELMGSLDLEQGEVARNLFNLYEYIHYRLVQGNIKKTVSPLEEAAGLLRELRDSWEEMCRGVRPEAPV